MLKTAAVFSDNMVFQRNKKVAIWGSGDKGIVEAELCDTAGNVVSDGEALIKDGSWEIYLGSMNAGGPYKLVLTSERERIEFNNIMVGEVFLAGGQSNMELELQNSMDGQLAVQKAEAEHVRFYYTPKVAWVGDELYAEENMSSWELCSPESCGRWSAVAYYFAKMLSEELSVTVGIIGCNWGGTSASCWVSRECLERKEALAPYLESYDKAVEGLSLENYIKEYEEYVVYQAEFDRKVSEYYKASPSPNWDEAIRLFGESKYPGPMGPRNFTRPCGLYEAMLSRVCPYTLKGFLFYQGEEDDHRPYTYKLLLKALIEQWRQDFRDESLYFMNVQLPVFLGEGDDEFMNWPFIREAQADVFNEVEGTGLAITLELGDKRNIHPLNKKDVGERLCLQALYHIYGYENADRSFAPMYEDYFVENDKLCVSFSHVHGGFSVHGDKINNFELAGEDGVYYPADAVIDGDKVILSAKEVTAPKYARYCFRNYCDVNFFGANGLPVAPFRTSREDGSKAIGGRNGLAV